MKVLIAIELKIWRNERTKPSCMLLKPQRDMMSRPQTMAYGWKITYCNFVQRLQRLRSTLFWTFPTDQRNYSNGSKELFKRLFSNTSNGLENNFQRPFSKPPTGYEKKLNGFPNTSNAFVKAFNGLPTATQRLRPLNTKPLVYVFAWKVIILERHMCFELTWSEPLICYG